MTRTSHLPTFLSLATILGICMLVFSGCPIRCDEDPNQHNVPASAKARVPFDGLTSFRMQHNAGATTTFTRTSIETDYYPFEQCPECCLEDEMEQIAWNYTGSGPAFSFRVTLARDWEPMEVQPLSRLNLSINGSYLRNIWYTPDSLAPLSNSAYQLVDSMAVQGQSYEGVYLMTYDAGSQVDYLDSLWYHPPTGLLKFSYSNGDFWELLP